MLIRIGISLAIIAITIFIHAFGSAFWIRYQAKHFSSTMHEWKLGIVLRVLIFFALFLILLHFIEILIWSIVYFILPDLHSIITFEEAVYFSLVTYTTLGYGDITLDPTWRMVSGFEAINGIILIGWSTAMFYSVVQNVTQKYRGSKSRELKRDK
jgi:voltage-gated potassium channel Kch